MAEPKNIIICLDGTWNKPDEGRHEENKETNVRNLWELLEKDEPQKQVVYYDEGVGSHWYDRIRGGVSGRGLSKNIREAYFEVCRHYVPGDRVSIFGFSRGAYTARSLAGMVYSCGVIPREQLTDNAIEEAFEVYKKADKPTRAEYKSKNITCEIEIVGVWDTVGALGIPVGFLKKYTNKFLQFHDTKINREIKHAYHALAIDEQRETFRPTLWHVRDKNAHQDIEQVWFAGVHSDVGGGYKQRAHSDIAFRWMIHKIRDMVLLDDSTYPYRVDATKEIHDSYKIYYGPKERRVASATDIYTPYVHASVLEKIQKVPDYRALALVDIEDRATLAPYRVVHE
ncbi:DUF2235 domain-containing protein [Sulfurimonas sp. HSL3-7]|uniref:DUF2235 domain-containing protein n=1 Tax=Sulfonitrofixus jiaomeiensis TaxID=3131938 RepID=UPI0031F81276